MIKLPKLPDHLNTQWPYLPHQLRARDIEVARAVLEAACISISQAHLDGTLKPCPPDIFDYVRAIRDMKIEGDTT
jgi:hypothetical protein